jgi:hypothetical protein
MNHPEHILRTLDRHLDHPVRLVLYGRSALSLGYADSPPEFQSTMDVDAILPEVEMSSIEADESFWLAIEKTNEELAPTGLYLTHLFSDQQVILRPTWLEHTLPIALAGLHHLSACRPSTTDLILTKMMRVDPQDRSDILYLLRQHDCIPSELRTALGIARVPKIPEIEEAFRINSAWLQDQPW